MNNDFINSSEFDATIPNDLKPFILVDIGSIPRSAISIVKAFEIAVASIHGKIQVKRPLHVVICKAPFELHLRNGILTYESRFAETINVYIDGFVVFPDWDKIMQHKFNYQVASILEELVHALMSIVDETLVAHVVALLYDGVVVEGGQYVASY